MKLIKMSYKGLTFNVNPSTVKIDFSKNISYRSIPFICSKAQEINHLPTVISGSGKFTGDNADEYAMRLEKTFRSTGSAYLFIPDATPIKAFFKGLSISYDSREGSVSYSFEFVEDCQGKKNEYDFNFTYAVKGENLYDVANRTGVDVGRIFELNEYQDLFSVKKGEKIWLS